MNDTTPGWKRMAFKGNKVWMAVDEDQRPIEKSGKVLVKYQIDQDYEYWVYKNSVVPVEQGQTDPGKAGKSARPPGKKTSGREDAAELRASLDEDAVLVFTDGASSGNPGPSGIGVLLRYRDNEKKISRYIGQATNNIAELTAIQAGLLEIKNKNLPVRVFTDSGYAYGLLTLGWKPKKNIDLVKDIQKLLSTFKDVKLIKVKGHAGMPENEAADQLAVTAVKQGA